MYEDGVRVNPRSRSEIESIAYLLRKGFGFPGKTYFPLMDFLEHGLCEIVRGFYYDVHPNGTLQDNARALAYPDKACILVEDSVYSGACADIGKDRMTIAHEIGHIILHRGIPLARRYEAQPFEIYKNSEWQGDVFAGELLSPIASITGMTTFKIVDKYKTSYSAANAQIRALEKKLHRPKFKL